MRRFPVLLAVALLALLPLATPAGALVDAWRWKSGGPYGAPIKDVVVDPRKPGHLWAVTPASGIFETDDEGAVWTRVSAGLTNPWGATWVTCLAVDASAGKLMAGTRLSGLFASRDGGRSWTASQWGFEGTVETISAIDVDPLDPDQLLAGTNAGLFRSDDGGASFQRVDIPGTSSVPGSVLALLRNRLSPERVYVSIDRAGLFASNDGGQNWAPAGDGLIGAPASLAFDAENPGTVWTGGSDGLHRWEASERRWVPIGAGLPRDTDIRSLLFVPGTSGGLFAGGRHGRVFVSRDRGDTWERLDAPMQPGPAILRARPSGGFYMAGGGGLFLSRDGGNSWETIDKGLTAAPIRSITLLGDAFGHLVLGTGIGAFKSTNFGDTWMRRNAGLKSNQFAINSLSSDPRRPARVCAGTEEGLVISDDGGDTWRSAPLSGWVGDVLCVPEGGGSILAAVLGSDETILYQSEGDGAQYRERLRTARDAAPWITATTRGDLFFFAGQLYRSKDGGATWELIPDPAGVTNITGLSDTGFGTGRLLAGTDNGLFVSEDRGATWSPFALSGKRVMAVEIHRLDPGWLAVLTDTGLFLSLDGGTEWSPVPLDGVHGTPTGIAIDPSRDFLYLTTENAIYTAAIPRPRKAVTVERIKGKPNPFSLGTTLSFDLKEAGSGDLTIFTINGDKVRQFNFTVTSAGPVEIPWDGLNENGERLPNGVYVAVVKTERDTWRGKLIKIG